MLPRTSRSARTHTTAHSVRPSDTALYWKCPWSTRISVGCSSSSAIARICLPAFPRWYTSANAIAALKYTTTSLTIADARMNTLVRSVSIPWLSSSATISGTITCALLETHTHAHARENAWRERKGKGE